MNRSTQSGSTGRRPVQKAVGMYPHPHSDRLMGEATADGQQAFPLFYNLVPVSYTHLDVYKRQTEKHSEPFMQIIPRKAKLPDR